MVDYLRTKSLWAWVSFLSLEKSKILRILLCNTEKTTLKWFTGQKMNFKMNFKFKFSIKGFFSKCDQIRRKPRNCSNLLKKSLMENFIFCAVVKRINPCQANVSFIYHFKSSWHLWFSDILGGRRRRAFAWNWLSNKM